VKEPQFVWVAAAIAIGCAASGWQIIHSRSASAQTIAVKASCDKRASLSQCSEYAEPAYAAGERFLKEPCSAVKGTFAPRVCSTESVVGTCAFGAAEVRRYYADGPNPYTVQTAARDCRTSEGTFTH
jgi:hypothetical protein